MLVESESLKRRAAVHAALGEPARLAIVEALAFTDASPSDLSALLGLPSNLLAHHLRILEEAGVVERARSEGDRRRSYVRLVAGLAAGIMPLSPRRRPRRVPRVLFICTRNSARSQLAVGLWRRRSRVPAASAGTSPAERVHPKALAVARQHQLRLGRARTAALRDVVRSDDLVVAVCDNAYEDCRSATPGLVHWSVPDPVRRGTAAAFARAYRDLEDRITRFAPTVVRPGEA